MLCLSRGETEAPAGEARLVGVGGRHLDLGLLQHALALDLLPPLALVVLALELLQVARETLNLVLVFVRLRLVHVELRRHRLHLPRLFAQVLLVHRQLFRYLGPGLPRQNVFELHVQLLLLLNEQVFLHHLLRLGDETLLERLDLLDHLVRGRVRALQLAPAVNIERVLQLLGERLHLGTLLQQLAPQVVHLALEHVDVGDGGLEDG
mmetsp:Transcript_27535/g.44022  ORF Transcript_27535/g.44022 Transcript_27535/m.44022 type:complete len:207 (+) Transcript_27535:1998-2618(+)